MDETNSSQPRCHACGSLYEADARQCVVCGERRSWRLTRRGILIESIGVIALVALVSGAMLWLRDRGASPIDDQGQKQASLIDTQPTRVPTFTPAPSPTASTMPNTPFPPTATAMPETVEHVVASGDTLIGIAVEYGVTLDDIQLANQLTSAHSLSIGQTLVIPLPQSAQAESEEQLAEAPADSSSENGESDTEPSDGDEPGSNTSEEETESKRSEDSEPDSDSDIAEVPGATGEPIVVQAAEVYRVQPGDNPLGIALGHDLSLDELLDLNGFSSNNPPLSIGQELVVRSEVVVTATPMSAAPASIESSEVSSLQLSEDADGVQSQLAENSIGQISAPRLLMPGPGSSVSGETPLLRWSSVGALPDDVYYVVTIEDITSQVEEVQDSAENNRKKSSASKTTDSNDEAREQAQLGPALQAALFKGEGARHVWVYSNSTALRIPPEFRPQFGRPKVIVAWSVSLRRKSPSGLLDLDLDDRGKIVSDETTRELRTFTWEPNAELDGDE